MALSPPKESTLLAPVIALLKASGYEAIVEAKFSRKRIDVLFVPSGSGPWISVELKISNWKSALWQAALNTEIADISYVALWESSINRAVANRALFESYGVGVICVSGRGATIILRGEHREKRTREQQQRLLMDERPARSNRLDPTSFLPT
jgi:hypothetical protein